MIRGGEEPVFRGQIFRCPHCSFTTPSSQGLEYHIRTVHPVTEPPKACIIATVFLGEQHPLLPPMRRFRDVFLPRLVMDLYYDVSVRVLRKIGRLCQN